MHYGEAEDTLWGPQQDLVGVSFNLRSLACLTDPRLVACKTTFNRIMATQDHCSDVVHLRVLPRGWLARPGLTFSPSPQCQGCRHLYG